MALNQVGLERLNTATTKKIGTSKNLIINGAMQVAQRATSATTNGFGSVDRFAVYYGNTDEAPTQEQISLTSGSPFDSGFKKAFKLTNGNQTSGAGSDDSIEIQTALEGQDINNSGWVASDPNSKLTISYWAKSSVGQTFFMRFRAFASSQYEYTYSVALSANTWTKVTHTVPGNSNFSSIVTTNAKGFFHSWALFNGTDQTNNKTLNQWAVKDNANKSPDCTSTWYTTNDATFEITGVQLEVGSVATDFEHKTFGQELALCQRYCQVLGGNQSQELLMHGCYNGTSTVTGFYEAQVQFRARPTFSISNVSHVNCYCFNGTDSGSPTSMSLIGAMTDKHWIYIDSALSSASGTAGLTVMKRANSTTSCKFTLDAEL